MVSETEHVHLK